MKVPFVDLKAQYRTLKDEMDGAMARVLASASFIGGEVIKDFEKAFAAYLGAPHCVGVANGTDAIEIALKALGIGPGDEVIVPALTWISTGGAVSNVGATPVFVDVLESERTIDPDLIEASISVHTKAIIPVHLYGLPAQMTQINRLAKKYDLKVIEDCAQAHGALYKGQKVGTLGDMATFSFYPGKNLGAYGDAGALVTHSEPLAKTSRMLANHGQIKKHSHQMIGRNSRLDTLQAAVLLAKLPYLDMWTQQRQQVARWYDAKLSGVKYPKVPDEMEHVYHLYVIQSEKRDELLAHLKSADIGCAIHYPTPLPFLACYHHMGHREGDFPAAEKLCKEILSLPMYPELAEAAVDRVGGEIIK